MKPLLVSAVALAFLLALAACTPAPQATSMVAATQTQAPLPGTPTANPPTGTPTQQEASQPIPATGTPAPETSEVPLQRMVRLSKEHLARKLGIDEAQIILVDVQAVEWPDASLGCPLTHSNYAQVITPGFSITLEVDNGAYAYHTDSLSHVILCRVLPTHEIFIKP